MSSPTTDLQLPEGANGRPLTMMEHAVALLEEAREKGLIYWEPRTQRGHERKADMLARIDAFLDRALDAAGGSNGQ